MPSVHQRVKVDTIAVDGQRRIISSQVALGSTGCEHWVHPEVVNWPLSGFGSKTSLAKGCSLLVPWGRVLWQCGITGFVLGSRG